MTIIAGPRVLLTLTALVVFAVAAAGDVMWGLYIRRSSQGRAVSAANFGSLIMALGAVNVVSYSANFWLLAPIVAGNWLGTFLVVRWDHRP